jgi:hypothetical protein
MASELGLGTESALMAEHFAKTWWSKAIELLHSWAEEYPFDEVEQDEGLDQNE